MYCVSLSSPIPHNGGEGQRWELFRPFAPENTTLGVGVGEVAETACHGHIRLLSGSFTPVQIALGRRKFVSKWK